MFWVCNSVHRWGVHHPIILSRALPRPLWLRKGIYVRAGGMPVAFMQEDILVKTIFGWGTSKPSMGGSEQFNRRIVVKFATVNLTLCKETKEVNWHLQQLKWSTLKQPWNISIVKNLFYKWDCEAHILIRLIRVPLALGTTSLRQGTSRLTYTLNVQGSSAEWNANYLNFW